MYQFFRTEFPKLTDFARREGKAIKILPLKVPLGEHNQASLIGTAIDYRVRIHLNDKLEGSPALYTGARRMQRAGSGLGKKIDSVWADSIVELLRTAPAGDELTLSRISVVLAWLDTGYRLSGRWSDGMRAVASKIDEHEAPSWSRYAAEVEEGVATEVSTLFQKALHWLPAGGAICGPEFAGSRAVGGADADLIVDNCLYDIKTTTNPRSKLPNVLRQLLGYVLLDWDDNYQLDHVGIYYSRQATSFRWSLAEMVRECTGSTSANPSNLRTQFRMAVSPHEVLRRDST